MRVCGSFEKAFASFASAPDYKGLAGGTGDLLVQKYLTKIMEGSRSLTMHGLNRNFARHKVGVYPSQTGGLLVIKSQSALEVSKNA